MNLTCFQLQAEGRLSEITFDELSAGWRRGEGQYWVDVEEYQNDELIAWLEQFQISDAIIKLSGERIQATRVIPLANEVLFQIPLYWHGDLTCEHQMVFLCKKNLCITFYPSPMGKRMRERASLIQEIQVQESSIPSLVYTLLVALSSQIMQSYRELRSRIRVIEDRMDKDMDDVEIEEILDQMEKVRIIDGVVSEQSACYDILGLIDTPALTFAGSGYFKNIISITHNLDRDIDRLGSRLETLRQRYAMNQQDRTNRRLAMLTVISAIFLPMTLFTGIYGMNFEYMPELKFHYAYPIALGFMATLAISLIWFFKHKGWFK
ncbi:MAG: CorA family divalent cation transporter [Xanthomonadales bacterium]|nr:CorA family divalent cation transporter [Xanthomonadales bacterium]